jgi:hypothetical protein
MRQLRMQLEGSLIRPFGMNCERERFAERFKYVDTQAPNLSPRRLDHLQEFLAKCHFLPRTRFKANDKMNGQAAPL